MEDDSRAQESPRNQVFVLTVLIGSGKSTVAAVLEALGACVISADELSRRAVEKSSPGLLQVVSIFGAEVLTPAGALDRKKMGTIVFSNPEKKKQLEGIIHPIVQELADKEFRNALASGPVLVVYECPLFFEAGLAHLGFRGVILVTAPEAACVQRIMTRDHLPEAEAQKRLASQIPLGEKIPRADYIVENAGTKEELAAIVRMLFERLAEGVKLDHASFLKNDSSSNI